MATFQELYDIYQKREKKKISYPQFMDKINQNKLERDMRKISLATDEQLIEEICQCNFYGFIY
jgi:hypothetical protein